MPQTSGEKGKGLQVLDPPLRGSKPLRASKGDGALKLGPSGLIFSDWADRLAGQAHEHPPCAPDDLVAAAPHPPVAELSRRLLRAQSGRFAGSNFVLPR